MAKKKRNSEITAARGIGRQFKKDMVIMLMIDLGGPSISYTSWGKTKPLSDEAKRLAEEALRVVVGLLGGK